MNIFMWIKNLFVANELDTLEFKRLYLRLVLWYSGVIACFVLFLGLIVAFCVPQILLFSTRIDLSNQTRQLSQNWQQSVDHTCPQSAQPSTYIVLCFTSNGQPLNQASSQQIPNSFRNNTLALAALRTHMPIDEAFDDTGTLSVDWHGLLLSATPALFRHTEIVTTPDGKDLLGILQIEQLPATTAVRRDQIISNITLGVVILLLLSIPIGGPILAKRAIQPALLSFRLQRDFIANISHELRTPLTLLRANADVLLRGRAHLREDDIALLEDIIAETVYINTLTEKMLLLARIDTGQIQIEEEAFDLTVSIASITNRIRSHAEQADIKLNTEKCSAIWITGDPVLLEQVMLILLDNAIKYNRPGGSINIYNVRKKEKVNIVIQDTGLGISSKHLSRLGERFFRADKARTREIGGNGLGLAIAHEIIALHHGTLTFESQPGEGTTVTLTLPIRSHIPF